MLKKIFKKKSKGNFGDILGSLVVVGLMILLLASTINVNIILEKNNYVNMELRRIILVLEHDGEYTGNIESLKDEFNEAGLTLAININDGNKSEYGKEVFVEIKATGTGTDLDMFPVLGMKNKTYTFSKRLTTISKAGR